MKGNQDHHSPPRFGVTSELICCVLVSVCLCVFLAMVGGGWRVSDLVPQLENYDMREPGIMANYHRDDREGSVGFRLR